MKVAQAPSSAVQFVKESRDELKKVRWPSREQTIRYTIIVVISSLVVGTVIGAVDYILTLILERFFL